MRFSRGNLAVGGAAILLCAFVLTNTAGQAQEPEGNFGVGIPDVFLPKYLNYRARQLNSSTPHVMRVPLGNVKGLSRSFTAMRGEMAVNLDSGAFNLTLNGLTPLQTYTVRLVDGSEATSCRSIRLFGLVTFLATGPSTLLNGLIPLNLPLGFTIDRVVVTPGVLPGTGPLASGSVNVFQKIFFRRLSLVNESTGVTLFQETTPAPALAALVPDLAAQTDALASSIGAIDGSSHAGLCLAVRAAGVLLADRDESVGGILGRIGEARQAHLERRQALFRGDVQRQRPHLRHLSSHQQQLHDRPGLHRHAAGQRSVVRGGVQPGARRCSNARR